MIVSFYLVKFLITLWYAIDYVSADDLVIQLNEPRGKIRGHALRSLHGKTFYGFQEIPYAAPPIGDYRFAEPQPHPGWSGVMNATTSKKVCMQIGNPFVTEDCLVLNVYTPVLSGTAKLPVMIWIHGGAFMTGSGNFQARGPEYFMDYGIIVVTINYRVDLFGFLSTEDNIIPGNMGLKDQLQALKWVNRNIALFGGDPSKVTLAGQSAGSISCSFHVVSQKATGLFRAAILESGTALVHGNFITKARKRAFQLAKILDPNFASNDTKVLLRLLRKTPAHQLLQAGQKIRLLGKQVGILPDLTWGIVMENKDLKNSYITKPMHQAFNEGHFDKIPMLIGYTSEEILTFIVDMNQLKDAAAKHDRNPANLISNKFNIAKSNQTMAGRKLKKLYTDKSFSQDLPAFVSFSSDMNFINSIIRKADLASRYVPVYLYQFSFEGTPHHQIIRVKLPNHNGIGHAEDLFYLWNFHFPVALTPHDTMNQQRMLRMWTNFVKAQNPTPTAELALGIPAWPPMKSNNLIYMDIDNAITLQRNPRKYTRVKEILDQYIQPPYNVF